MQLQPPTITDVLLEHGIDPNNLPTTDDRGTYICPICPCSPWDSGAALSRHTSNAHNKSVMECVAEDLGDETKWEDALRELVMERGYALTAISKELPPHSGKKSVRNDAQKYDLDYRESIAGGPNSQLQHFKPEEIGLSPIGEARR